MIIYVTLGYSIGVNGVSDIMKKLIDNPNWSYDLGQRLYETVKDTYDLNKVTKDRSELYKSLLK